MVDNDADLKAVTDIAGSLSSKVCGSVKSATALRNALSRDNTHSSVRSPSGSVTRRWVGHETILEAHIKPVEEYKDPIFNGNTNLSEFENTVARRAKSKW